MDDIERWKTDDRRWEVERDRFGTMFSGSLDVGECIEVAPAAQLRRVTSALAKADAEVTALADALRAAGVKPLMVQAIIDDARPRERA